MPENTSSPAVTPTATPAPSAPAAAETPKAPEATSALGAATVEPAKDAAPPEAVKPAEPADKKPAPALELQVPDGFTDAAAVEGIKALAGELGLDSPKAQQVLEKFAGWQQAQAKQADEAFAQQDKAWAEALQKDPDIGGQRWAAAQKDIGRAVTHFKAQGAMKLLHSAGLGNHPELVRLMAKVGQALREDSVAGTSAAPAPSERLSDAVLFYGPNTNPATKGE